MKNRFSSVLCFTILLLTTGCTEVRVVPNFDHCARNEGDRYCEELFPELPYCNRGRDECAIGDRYGCVAEVTPECHAPCGVLEDDECLGGESTGTETGTGTGTGTETGSESSTTGPVPCAGDEDCPDAAAPFCAVGSGACVACDGTDDPDAACAGVDPSLPLCVGGACVQCTEANATACTGKTPVCDEASNTCVPCTAHDQCGEAACNLYVGACLPADAVVHVGPGEEHATLGEAVAVFGPEEQGTIVVHAGTYNEAVTVGSGRVLAFLAAPGDLPLWILAPSTTPQLTAGPGTTVLVDGLQLSGNGSSADPGVLVNGGQAWLDRTRVVQNSGGGIVAQSNAELVLRNCFVGGGTEVIGVEVIDASARVVYTTVVASTFMSTPAFGCTSPGMVDIRNSIVVSQGGSSPDELSCAGADVVTSATEADVGSADILWFVDFNGGDFSLSGTGATTFADIAQWQTGDPLTDIDGAPRPASDGTPDHAGADIP
jgi:hypothetical protein